MIVSIIEFISIKTILKMCQYWNIDIRSLTYDKFIQTVIKFHNSHGWILF